MLLPGGPLLRVQFPLQSEGGKYSMVWDPGIAITPLTCPWNFYEGDTCQKIGMTLTEAPTYQTVTIQIFLYGYRDN